MVCKTANKKCEVDLSCWVALLWLHTFTCAVIFCVCLRSIVVQPFFSESELTDYLRVIQIQTSSLVQSSLWPFFSKFESTGCTNQNSANYLWCHNSASSAVVDWPISTECESTVGNNQVVWTFDSCKFSIVVWPFSSESESSDRAKPSITFMADRQSEQDPRPFNKNVRYYQARKLARLRKQALKSQEQAQKPIRDRIGGIVGRKLNHVSGNSDHINWKCGAAGGLDSGHIGPVGRQGSADKRTTIHFDDGKESTVVPSNEQPADNKKPESMPTVHADVEPVLRTGRHGRRENQIDRLPQRASNIVRRTDGVDGKSNRRIRSVIGSVNFNRRGNHDDVSSQRKSHR